jgi:hypothetical protein
MISAHGDFSDLACIAVLIHDLDIVETAWDTVEREFVAGLDDSTTELIPSPTAIGGRRKVEMVNGKSGFVGDHELTSAALWLYGVGAQGQQSEGAENYSQGYGRADHVAFPGPESEEIAFHSRFPFKSR